MKNIENFAQLMGQFSAEDSKKFESLLQALNQVGGQLDRLPEEQRTVLEMLQSKYTEAAVGARAETSLDASRLDASRHPVSGIQGAAAMDIDSPFTLYVRNVLFRDLCQEEQTLPDAVAYAFEHKWLPQELRNKQICETKYAQYKEEIETLNQWRDEFSTTEQSINDQTMSIGLAWFMKVYQLKQHYSA